MTTKQKKRLNAFFDLFISTSPLSSLISIFDNEGSKVISSQGKMILQDEEKLNDLFNKIENNEITHFKNVIEI